MIEAKQTKMGLHVNGKQLWFESELNHLLSEQKIAIRLAVIFDKLINY